MVPNYGEGKDYAIRRLRREIDELSERPGRLQNPPNPSIMIPFGRDEDFVERPTLLSQISQKCGRPGSRTAIVGLGGVGKSQLAIEYAYRIQERSPKAWVFWVHASNAARFEQSFREIATHVTAPGRHDSKANIFQLVRGWLADERNGCWVLILDNLDNANFLTASYAGGGGHTDGIDGTNSLPLIRCLPQCQHGSVLVTSRNRQVASELVEDRDIITVDPMDKEHALTLLRRKLGQHQAEAGGSAEELAAALEYMPLAIVQAAAYISQTWPPCSVQQYLDKFRKSDRRKAGLLSYAGGKLRRDPSAKNSILNTWQISFDHVHDIRPSAIHVLSLMSFCDRQGIPASLLRGQDGETKRWQEQDSRARNAHDSDDTGFRGGGDDDDDDDNDDESSYDEDDDGLKDDIMTLRQFSFISANKDGKTLEMHRLVQLATLEWLEAHGQQDHWRHRLLRRLCERLPTGEYENWGECQVLFPHVKSATAVAPKEEQSLQDWATVLYKAAWYAWRVGNGLEAEKMAIQAMEMRKKVLGQEREETINAIAMVGLAYKLRGRWEEAEKLEVQVMETSKTKLGADHPFTLTSIANLASTLWNQGRWEEAEKLDVQAMETRKTKLGADHPSTLKSIANLASTYRNQGRWEEAEKLFVQVVETRKTKLGADHPDTLTSMANLASTFWNQGRWEEAEKLFVQVMETSKTKLGADHPDTLTSIANLASTLWNQGRWEEAEKLFVQVMETSKTKLGADHPDTLTSIANLASTLWNQGRWEEAEKLDVQVMETRKTKLGADHPSTLISMHNLAFTWKSQGRYQEALALIEDCARAQQRVIGMKHPDTLSSLAAVEQWRSEGVSMVKAHDM
ncbi:P-loop containing nucleoside triphosphate hydrolase protein [Cercophora newfieldiana]|uniref:P-loop containing nucleoside triphosphate hydrolase protein n=1 Tax=Cercophora newfieldiana TaxID=92897 RepID=A0AA39YBB0_9PEZI|nr:P-loop containing nucleoside triphosphate hydrolase protein [Cercophora newfieldiana]